MGIDGVRWGGGLGGTGAVLKCSGPTHVGLFYGSPGVGSTVGWPTPKSPCAGHRQSKLTAALKDALGGNCRTVMVANLWPEAAHLEECVSTLRFASRVRMPLCVYLGW